MQHLSALLTSVFAFAAFVAGAPLPTTTTAGAGADAVPTMDLGVPSTTPASAPAPTIEDFQQLWVCQPIMGPDMVMMCE